MKSYFLLLYLTNALYTDAMVFGITAEGTIVGGNKQLSLTTDGCALQVTWLIGDTDVIGYRGNYIFQKYIYFIDLDDYKHQLVSLAECKFACSSFN